MFWRLRDAAGRSYVRGRLGGAGGAGGARHVRVCHKAGLSPAGQERNELQREFQAVQRARAAEQAATRARLAVALGGNAAAFGI